MIDLTAIAKSFEGVLTLADVEAIYKAMPGGQGDLGWVRNHVLAVMRKVADFSERHWEGHLTDEVKWFMTVTEDILRADGHSIRFPTHGIKTRGDVIDFVEQRAEEDDRDDREEWEASPDEYRAYHRRDRTGHAWGSTLAVIRQWFKATPYEVWAIYDAVRDTATATLLENLEAMAVGSKDGERVGSAAEREFEKQMKALYTRLEAAVSAAG